MRNVARLVLALSLLLPLLGPSGGWSAGVAGASTPVEKIDPELKGLMAAEPLRLLPVIVEMAPHAPPFPAYANGLLAQRGLALLTLYGRPVGALDLIGSAAGFATAA